MKKQIKNLYDKVINKIAKATDKVNRWLALWMFLSVVGVFNCLLIVPQNPHWYNIMAGLIGGTMQTIITKIMEDIAKRMEKNNHGKRKG